MKPSGDNFTSLRGTHKVIKMIRRIRWRWMLLMFLSLAWGISDAAAAGQAPFFRKVYERPGTANAEFYAVQGPLADGSFLLGGHGFVGESERDDLFVARIDQQGRFLWGRAIGNQIPGGPWNDEKARIVSTTDGGLVVIGLSSNGTLSRLIGARLDGQGNVQWVRFYVNHGGGIGSVTRAPDGSFIVALYELYDNFLIVGRLAEDGTVSWSGIYSPPAGWSVIGVAAVVAAPAGEFLVVGAMLNTNDLRDRDIFAIRLDGQGGVLWSKRYGNQADNDISNEPRAVVSTPDGGFLIAGVTGRRYDLPQRTYMLRIDAQGNVLWAQTYATTTSQEPDAYESTQPQGILRLAGGGFVMVGYTVVPGNLGLRISDLYALRISETGDVLWQRSYGGASFDSGEAVVPTADGGLLLVGNTQSFAGDRVVRLYLVKTDEAGLSGCNERIPQLVIRTPTYHVDDITWSVRAGALRLSSETNYQVKEIPLQERSVCFRVCLPLITRTR